MTALCSLPAPGTELVLKTDPVVAGVHFFPDDDPADIAWKALAVNVSDLAAKGATPLIYLMALSLPEAPERAWMAKFAAGLGEAQRAFGIQLAGGDTDRTPGHFSIAITVVGEVPAGRMVRRAAARAGQAIYVSGTLGIRRSASRCGRMRRWPRGSDSHRTRWHGRSALPAARAADRFGRGAAGSCGGGHGRVGRPVKDLGRMCRASGVGARVVAADLPLSPGMRRAVEAEPDRIDAAVAAGDDYEILATMAPASCAAFEAAARAAGVAVTRIGEITATPEVCVLGADGAPLSPARSGWDHFQTR